MCVTFCHKLNRLYWDHEDCHPALCSFAGKSQESCATCRHKNGETCRLTNTVLPQEEGCCHYNVNLIQGPQVVTTEMVSLLEVMPDEAMAEALTYRNVSYQQGSEGEILVDPDELPLPTTYGRGTDHQADESFDWTGWYEQWDSEER